MKRLFAQRCYLEVGGRPYVGNPTTAELESFIAMEKAT
jgi:hypothetical protein